MSWDEVKKAINSDLNVPLNERMGYVSGIIPRGAIKKSYSKAIGSGSYRGTVLEIEGRGILVSAAASRSYSSTAFHASMTINIDNGKKIIQLAGEDVSGTGTASLKVELDNVSSVGDVSGSEVQIGFGESIILNYPIYFEESIKVDIYIHSENFSYQSGASVECLLF